MAVPVAVLSVVSWVLAVMAVPVGKVLVVSWVSAAVWARPG